MRSFKDLQGRPWTIAITVGTLRDVAAQFDGLQLLDLADPAKGGFEQIFDDLPFFVDLLEFLTREQAAKLNITPDDFGRGLAGDVLLDAQNAFLEAFCDFFPNRQRRETMLLALQKARLLEEAQILRHHTLLEEMDLDQLAALASSTPSAGSSPVKSASTPRHLASANSAG